MDISLTPQHVLIIDDEENMRHLLSVILKNAGYHVDAASDGLEGIQKCSKADYDFILCDIKMPKMDGMSFLKALEEKIDQTTVIMMSAYGTLDTAISAMKLGAYDYISKPFHADEILLVLKKAEERENLRRENRQLKSKVKAIEANYRFGSLVAKSKSMENVFLLATKISMLTTTVLIYGESGTGKDLVAKGIHFNGNRSGKSFVPVNCGGIPENLLESELFGYKKGAFTGADRDKSGLFKEADGGTIFLDEIGELPLTLQVKLLRVLQDREIRPIGDARVYKVDVRVIAATSKNLEEEVARRTFREDLFYRLNVMKLKLPPLRERLEDIPVLIRLFIQKFNQEIGRRIQGVSPPAMAALLAHDWPGNVRELENVIERAVVLAETQTILPENLPESLGRTFPPPITGFYHGFSLKEAQKIMEKQLIENALDATDGNRTKAGKLLEISHPSLLSKIKSYHIEK